MAPAHLAVVMALLAALLWGGGDFAGGFATRRASPLQVILLAQGLDALILLAAIAARHTAMPGPAAMWWAVGGGICNGLGLICLYTALAIAEMGLAAAISGILTAALPALVSARIEGAPSPRHLLGFAVAGVAMWRISSAPTHAPAAQQRRSLWLAAIAGVGFGVFLICSRQSSRHGLLWPLLVSRVAGIAVALALLLLSRLRDNPASGAAGEMLRWRPLSWPLLGLGCIAGVLDVTGNLFFMGSTQLGRMDVCAVLASLYPAGTILLAMALLRERATPAQALGMGLALAAVTLIAG